MTAHTSGSNSMDLIFFLMLCSKHLSVIPYQTQRDDSGHFI